MVITSQEELKQYCLRRLGYPVHNVEIEDTQAYERIDDALKFFVERHFDGVEEQWYKHTITRRDTENGYITTPKELVSVSEVMTTKTQSSDALFDIEYQIRKNDTLNSSTLSVANYYVMKSHLKLIQDIFSPERRFDFNFAAKRITPQWTVSDVGSENLLKDVTDVGSPTWTKTNATATSLDAIAPKGDLNAHTVTSTGAGEFSISQTFDTKTIPNAYITQWAMVKHGTHAGPLTMKMTTSDGTIIGSATTTSTGKWQSTWVDGLISSTELETITMTISGVAVGAGESFFIYNPWMYVNTTVILHGYTALNENANTDVFNDRWLKEYTTALFKRQWGANTKKFEGIQLPGGVTMNGLQIFQEAEEEIRLLQEEFSVTYEEPVDFMWG